MRGYLARTLIMAVLACCVLAATKTNNICDTCKCLPDSSAERARDIQCTCGTAIRAITTTVENMKELPHLESFTAINCDSVSFQQQSFGNKHDLSNVILKGVKMATFPLGVFAKLDSLKIEDVEDLRLMAKAFLGAEIGEIAIRNSTIKEIPELALYNVKLRKLELSDVTIGNFKSNSTLFEMGEQSNLNIDRCKVNRVEKQGLELRAQNLRISGTTLTHLAPSSTIINAAIGVDIIASTFSDSADDGMSVTSPHINIFNNTFYSIPIAVKTGQGGKVTITNNFVRRLSFNTNVFAFLNSEFIRNSFLCDCDFAQSLKSVVSLQASSLVPNFEEILTNNFCQANCNLSVKAFFEQIKDTESCTPETMTLCPEVESMENREGEVSTTMSSRSGRRDNHDDNLDYDEKDDHRQAGATTKGAITEGSALKSGQATFGASSLLVMAILFWRLF